MKKHIKSKDLEQVKKLDLLTYLMNYEPDELIKISRYEYGTKTHSSLKISNGMWTWWAKSIGGKSALDYLIKVKGYEFLEATYHIKNCITNKEPTIFTTPVINNSFSHSLKLPTPNGNNDKIIKYLCEQRCIDREIVDYCIKHYNLYESKNHEVIFVGYDNESKARYATKRSIVDDEKRDISNSNKRFGFQLSFSKSAKDVHVFEGAIDLLSYLTILKQRGVDWHCDDYLSLGNASLLGKSKERLSIPVALEEYLLNHKDVESLHLHLDDDKAGHETSEKIQFLLDEDFTIFDKTLKKYNDVNECLQRKSLNKSKEYMR